MLDISVKQMKYAVEIAHCKSINQAAQNLSDFRYAVLSGGAAGAKGSGETVSVRVFSG